jgi:hypothetical protein
MQQNCNRRSYLFFFDTLFTFLVSATDFVTVWTKDLVGSILNVESLLVGSSAFLVR